MQIITEEMLGARYNSMNLQWNLVGFLSNLSFAQLIAWMEVTRNMNMAMICLEMQ
jgi:hypothetical protein